MSDLFSLLMPDGGFDCPHQDCYFWHRNFCGAEVDPMGRFSFCSRIGETPAESDERWVRESFPLFGKPGEE